MDASQSHRFRTSRRSPFPSAPTTTAVGSVRSIWSYRVGASPTSPTVHTPASFSVSSARAMFTTSAIGTWGIAPADAFAPPPSSPPAGHAIRPGRFHRPQNRPDVVRIFNAVEHDNERHALRAYHEIFHAQGRRVFHVGDEALAAAAA